MHIDTDLFSSPLSLSLSTSTLTSTFTSTFALIDWFFDWVIWLYIYRRIHISKYNIDNVYIILVFYIYHRLSISIIYTSLSSPLLPPKLRSSGLAWGMQRPSSLIAESWTRWWTQWTQTFTKPGEETGLSDSSHFSGDCGGWGWWKYLGMSGWMESWWKVDG